MEGRTVDEAPQLDNGSGLVYFGNRICPFAHRALWVIIEKGIQVDSIHIPLGPLKPSWYVQKINELGTVPCIYDNGKPVFESLNVVEFLEEKFKGQGPSFMPKDPHERASIRFFTTQFNEKLKIFYQFLRNGDETKREELKQELLKTLKYFNEQMKNQSEGPYFLGKDISLADIALIPFVARMSLLLKHYQNFDIFEATETSDRILSCFEHCKSRKGFQNSFPDSEVIITAYVSYAPKKQ